MGSLILMFFFNSLGFLMLYTLDIAVNIGVNFKIVLYLFGYFSFFIIDLFKIIFEIQIYEFLTEMIIKDNKKIFKFNSSMAEITGKIFGSFIASLVNVNKNR